MDPPRLCDHDGEEYPPSIQSRVPGRDLHPSLQLDHPICAWINRPVVPALTTSELARSRLIRETKTLAESANYERLRVEPKVDTSPRVLISPSTQAKARTRAQRAALTSAGRRRLAAQQQQQQSANASNTATTPRYVLDPALDHAFSEDDSDYSVGVEAEGRSRSRSGGVGGGAGSSDDGSTSSSSDETSANNEDDDADDAFDSDYQVGGCFWLE